MELQFAPKDLEKWAHFSGDYNPIHFDEEVAVKEFGLDGVIAHGMLALLPLKDFAARATWETNGWIQWQAQLKRALPIKHSYAASLVQRPAGGILRFGLAANGSPEKSISGICSPVDFDTSIYAQGPRFEVSPANLGEKLDEFRAGYPDIEALWIFLDALIFSEYMTRHARTMFQEELFEHYGIDSRSQDISRELIVMQTTHMVTATPSLMRRPLAETPREIAYDAQKKGRVVTKDAVFALVDLPVWIDGKLELVAEMGVMARRRV